LMMADHTSAGLADLQQRGAFHIAGAEMALEQGRADDASEQVERALDLAAGTDDLEYRPEMCDLGVRALAERLEFAQAHGRPVDVDKFRLLARGMIEQVESLIAGTIAGGGSCTPRTLAFAAMCSAEASRLHASDPEAWAQAATDWETAGAPYPVAY